MLSRNGQREEIQNSWAKVYSNAPPIADLQIKAALDVWSMGPAVPSHLRIEDTELWLTQNYTLQSYSFLHVY